jgi:hypothetical protein
MDQLFHIGKHSGYHLFGSIGSSSSNNSNSNNSTDQHKLAYYSYIIQCLKYNLFNDDPSTESAAFLLIVHSIYCVADII